MRHTSIKKNCYKVKQRKLVSRRAKYWVNNRVKETRVYCEITWRVARGDEGLSTTYCPSALSFDCRCLGCCCCCCCFCCCRWAGVRVRGRGIVHTAGLLISRAARCYRWGLPAGPRVLIPRLTPVLLVHDADQADWRTKIYCRPIVFLSFSPPPYCPPVFYLVPVRPYFRLGLFQPDRHCRVQLKTG